MNGSPDLEENRKNYQTVASDTSIKITSSNLGVMGGFGFVGGLGSASVSIPATVAGTVVCIAAYGAKKAIQDKDCSALISVTGGAFTGAGISAVLSGISLVVAETAVSVSLTPVVAAGATIGLAGYGLTRLVQRVQNLNYLSLKNSFISPLRSKL
ncbi:MAG: hypothetical protein SWJ54_10960 [Cyanobacteriota bacterium]|nr:hypothetical protein [Cyanobacteriota bacterium]